MANVRICDRCGKKLERANKLHIDIRPYRYVLYTETYDTDEEFDLCPSCEKDFRVFMQGPSTGETGETKE